MTATNFKGPLLISGPAPNFGSAPDYDAQTGTSLFVNGSGLLDPRPQYTYVPGGSDTSPACGFLASSDIIVLDQVPSAINAANIAASQVAVAGVGIVLVGTSGAGITAGTQIVNQNTGTTVNVVAIDGVASRIAMGSAGPVQLWDPRTLIARNVRITSAGNDSAGAFLVQGFDIYGFSMSELIVGANAGVAAGRKAFKYIAAVTPQTGVSGGNVTVGTGDVYGFPILAQSWFYTSIYWAGAFQTAQAGFMLPDPTNPATSSTGDVRGTYAVQSASDGVKALQVAITVAPQNVATIAGLFGQTQS